MCAKQGLTRFVLFDNTAIMETEVALTALTGLAHESRLAIFRLLVQAGPEGLAAGVIAERLEIPNATLSFHLKELAHARLVNARQAGRFIYYSADYATMNGIVAFLGENCCMGAGCETARPPARTRRRSA